MREGWREVELAEVLRQEFDPEDVTAGRSYPIVGVLNRGQGLLWRTPVTSATTSYPRLNRVGPGRVIYRKLTAFEGTVAVAPDDLGEAYASSEFPTFRCLDGFEPSYARLVMQRRQFWDDMARVNRGIGGRRGRLHPQDFLKIRLPLPRLADQRRIVDLIDTLDAALNSATAASEACDRLWWALCIELAEEAKTGSFAKLGDIADISGGLTKNRKDDNSDGLIEVPYLRVANVHRRYLDLSDVALIKTTPKKLDALRLYPGDILLNEGGDRDKLGRGAVWRGQIDNCIHQNHVFRARLTVDTFVPEFVSAWGNSFGKRWFEENGTQTTGIASINRTTLGRFPIPSLSKERQIQWAELLDGVFDQIEAHNQSATRLRILRSALLDALVSGKHQVPEEYDDLLGDQSCQDSMS